MRLALLLSAFGIGGLAPAAVAAETDVIALLGKVESRYNGARTLQVEFSETYSMPGRGRIAESGLLSLRKPGRMRWAYSKPEGKLFVSDGTFLYYYSPDSQRAEKGKLKESDDMRAPLAFLLGRLEFSRDFKEYRSRAEGADTWITAIPKSDKLPYTEVSFVVTAAGQIRRLVVTGQDRSLIEFTFSNERLNPAVGDALFQFVPPKGVQVLDMTAQ